ncbi:transcription factor ORG2-like [Macadamia integrifolia]|uniref:transcription factor ORG2-like n=1 Tax=Macadamia integrifolia TaxID=60698 RepID=UPI001C4FD5F6|nr:transcription factor ORG2-like [Macadamia integrifolia]
MLTISPPLYSTLGWPTDDHIRQEQEQKNWIDNETSFDCNNRETEALDLCPPFHSLEQQIDLGDDSIPSSAINNDPGLIKKLSHNAGERDRRKKLNNLYSSLGSLLPGIDNTRKLSIPATISRVLKYIPELQKQVERLKQRKDEILASVYNRGNSKGPIDKQRNGIIKKSLPTVSVSQVDEGEVLIHICSCKNTRSPFSEILQNLEDEGLQVLNVFASVSSSSSSGEVLIYNLHLKMRENQRLDCNLLRQKLLSMCENKEELF